MNSKAPSPDAHDEPAICAAAVLSDGSADIDAQLAAFAERHRLAGLRVRGLVMTYPDGGSSCHGAMVLRDIDTADEYLVSQSLGGGSTGCRADPQGFARASQVLRKALAQAPDLVVCNRFGNLEAENSGFAAELLELMAQGIPVFTVVAARHLQAWRNFSGDAPVLPPQPEAWDAWVQRTPAAARLLVAKTRAAAQT